MIVKETEELKKAVAKELELPDPEKALAILLEEEDDTGTDGDSSEGN